MIAIPSSVLRSEEDTDVIGDMERFFDDIENGKAEAQYIELSKKTAMT